MGLYPVTIQVSDALADRLKGRSADLPQILERGLREIEAEGQLQFDGAADVLEFLATLPDPADVLALRPSESLQARIEWLLDRNRTQTLTDEEAQEWEQVEYLEHLVRLAKLNARLKLDG